MILIYAFSNQWGTNISRRTLLELQKLLTYSLSSQNNKEQRHIEFRLIYFHPKDFFQKYIIYGQYNLIIGLGDLSCNFNKIRIETQTKNVYNNQTIYPFSPILLDLSLPNIDNYSSRYFAISSSMGTYNCNWIVYSIQLHINQKHLNTKQLFLHLPKKFNATLLASQIKKDLLELNNLI